MLMRQVILSSRPSVLVLGVPRRLLSSFHSVADETLESILSSAISLEEKHDDLETELASGVLTIKFENAKKSWVLNKQAPNEQIWLSSPISGPARFELRDDGTWRHTRQEQRTLRDILRDELQLDYEQ